MNCRQTNNNSQTAAELANACNHPTLSQYLFQLEASQGNVYIFIYLNFLVLENGGL